MNRFISVFEMFNHPALWISIFTWFLAQLIKVLLDFYQNRRIDFSRWIGSGGMPSSHTAFMISLTTTIGLYEGFGTSIFVLALGVSLVVMSDAAGVRRAAGHQAKVLNEIAELLRQHMAVPGDKLRELLGHTPLEVIAGAVLGIAVALLLYNLF